MQGSPYQVAEWIQEGGHGEQRVRELRGSDKKIRETIKNI